MRVVSFFTIATAILMLPFGFACGDELSDWRARLIDRIWWFENEKTLHEIELKARSLQEETAKMEVKYSQVYKRFSADRNQISAIEQQIQAMKTDIAQKKRQYINVIDEERKLAKAEALLAKIKARHKENDKYLKDARTIYEGKMSDLKNLQADIKAWRARQPDINRLFKESGHGEIYFNDIFELFEHIKYIVGKYDLMPDRRASDSDLSMVRGFPLEKLMEMMEQGESGRFKHPALDKVFHDPEGIKMLIGRLGASGRKYGFSEKDRVTAMKMLVKALAQATRTHGTDMPKTAQAAQNIYDNVLKQRCLVQADLTEMYDHFISTGATERTPGKEDPK